MPNNIFHRWQVVVHWQEQRKKDIKAISARTGQSGRFIQRWVKKWLSTGDVQDDPRAGRKRKFTEEQLMEAESLLEKKEARSSKDIAARLNAEFSSKTVRRRLNEGGMKYALAKKVPLLSPAQRQARVNFSRKNARTSWRSVLVTDSKIFPLNPSKSSATLKYWGYEGSHLYQPCSRDARKVHVYGGVSLFGFTKLHYVTPTTGLTNTHIDHRTNLPYRGVCAAEYHEVLRETFLPEGQRLFRGSGRWANSWVLQQDGASSHTSNSTKLFLEQQMPDRVLESWPSCSPDLSWIENVWAHVDRELRKAEYESIDAFKVALQKIWGEVGLQYCKNAVKGMPARLRQCIANNGGHIGK
jgi:transposase